MQLLSFDLQLLITAQLIQFNYVIPSIDIMSVYVITGVSKGIGVSLLSGAITSPLT